MPPSIIAPLALTIGDPSGIGPEIAIKAWLTRRGARLPCLLRDRRPGLDCRARQDDRTRSQRSSKRAPTDAAAVFQRALPVAPLTHRFLDRPGEPRLENAAGIIEAIDRAVDDVLDERAAALVTAPVAKKLLYDAGFAFPGHTEYLGHLASQRTGRTITPVMMLAGPALRTVPVTIHIPLSQVPSVLSTALIVTTGRIVADSLRDRFGIARPRLAVAGLNPHAGEGGAIGSEDIEIVAPAVARLCAEGIGAFGPLAADTMFHQQARATYDAAICMYHDQALIPAKALAFDEAVNVTLGLPFIRTSPDHGTAFDIAGTGAARPDSLIAALKLAGRLTTVRLVAA